jgi:phosphoribosylformylglycinamidine (FGAM) synthase-like amidotransferase family enzyme
MKKSGAKVENEMVAALNHIQQNPTNHINTPTFGKLENNPVAFSSLSKLIFCGGFGAGLYSNRKAISPTTPIRAVIKIGIRQPKLSPNLPKVVKHIIVPTGIAVL